MIKIFFTLKSGYNSTDACRLIVDPRKGGPYQVEVYGTDRAGQAQWTDCEVDDHTLAERVLAKALARVFAGDAKSWINPMGVDRVDDHVHISLDPL